MVSTSNNALGVTHVQKTGKHGSAVQRSSANNIATAAGFAGPSPLAGGIGADIGGPVLSGIDTAPVLSGIIDITGSRHHDLNKRLLDMYRDIYYFDSVAGATVDMYANLPFSDYTLGGLDDKDLEKFNESLNLLSILTLLPEITIDHLVLGAHISIPIFDAERKVFKDLMPIAPDACEYVIPPLYNQDPIIEYKLEERYSAFFKSKSNRVQELIAQLPKNLINSLQKGKFELDPLTTIWLPRRTLTGALATSYFKRLLLLHLTEKSLWRGTLIESQRRIRSIVHIVCGDDSWEPTPEDMQYINQLFLNADIDPLGAYVATRNGVQATELKQGGEFWKVFDTWGDTVPAKFRSLGVSEAFLCTTGDTLIPTEHGLLRIDSLGDGSRVKDKPVEINVKVAGTAGQAVNAVKWYYRGNSKVYSVTANHGYSVKLTPKHKVLTLADDYSFAWKHVEDLTTQDYLCIENNPVISNKKLRLNLSDSTDIAAPNSKQINKPTYMDTDLAYICGMVVSEGMLNDYRVRISNSDIGIINKYKDSVSSVFGSQLYCSEHLESSPGINVTIGNTETVTTKYCYSIEISSSIYARWLQELGIEYLTIENGEYPSYRRTIPWSILEADEESQLAFIAAYLDGDGNVSTQRANGSVEVSFYSRSITLLRQMQIMLSNLGYHSRLMESHYRLTLPHSSSGRLLARMSKYMGSHKSPRFVALSMDRTLGLPTEKLRDFIQTRKQEMVTNVGSWFIDDCNNRVLVEGWARSQFPPSKIMLDSSYRDGIYDNGMDKLQAISAEMYNNIYDAINSGYRFEKVVSVQQEGNEDLFDISIEKGKDPAFIGNAIVIHNSGEASYNNMETSLSVFMDGLRAFRVYITKELIEGKIFPLIALANGLYTDKYKITKDTSKDRALTAIRNLNNLKIPTLTWSKSLEPEGDEQYFSQLQTLTDAGIPVPLRAWAAAGSFNLDDVMDGFENDLESYKKIAAFNKKKNELTGGNFGTESGGGDEFGEPEESFEESPENTPPAGNAPPGNKQRAEFSDRSRRIRKPLLARNLEEDWPELIRYGKTGKPLPIRDQKRAHESVNRKLAKAVGVIRRREQMRNLKKS